MISSLYIHIPFCELICAYCDFSKVMTGTFSQEKYLSCLFKDIENQHIPDHSLKTIYIGGGTPTALRDDLFEQLLSYLNEHFSPLAEFTVEANPESLTEEKIRLCLRYGVNRISLGVQTTDDSLLKKLNRNHSVNDVINAVKRLQINHFENYNLDFIYGIPTMTMKDVDADIDFALSLSPKHLSFYSLQIEPGTLLYNQKVQSQDDSFLRECYDHICDRLSKANYPRYEISNFAIPGYESKHNLTYWHAEEYYAAGLSASGYMDNLRFTNTRSMNRYLQNDTHPVKEEIDADGKQFEFLMLNLRLVSGFSLAEFERRFQEDFLLSYQKEIEKVSPYVETVNGFFRIKKDYLYTMDQILLSLLK